MILYLRPITLLIQANVVTPGLVHLADVHITMRLFLLPYLHVHHLGLFSGIQKLEHGIG
jgi:hypothetical protein